MPDPRIVQIKEKITFSLIISLQSCGPDNFQLILLDYRKQYKKKKKSKYKQT